MTPQAFISEHRSRYPHAYFVVQSDDAVAQNVATLRRSEFELWQKLVPEMDADFDAVLLSTSRLTGLPPNAIEAILVAHLRLREMPCLDYVQRESFLLDSARLKAIDQALARVSDPEVIVEIDRRIARYLVPTRPHQLLPSAAQLRRKVKDLVRLLCPEDKDEESREPQVYFNHGDDGRSSMELLADTPDVAEAEAIISAHAKRQGINQGAALLSLLKKHSSAKVVLNLYRASDIPNAPGFMHGVGWMSSEQANELARRASTIRHIDTAEHQISRAYVVPERLRAFVAGRDGVCRFPGCSCRADKAQMDHTVDFSDGGKTTPNNLAALCPHHHNMKTDARVFPIHVGEGTLLWLLEDGTWDVTQPEGPLARKNRHWVRTLAQKMTARKGRP
ncbi:HNH endonuclease signature motif containing protein [Corynebacterium tapiri]|uniref:HNH endonuclease n=1 Tax=Corynebacterium tapiri TaxID=1448266 RepID=A0A5C4U465_9CORY|nr:HNH endonuclease signature motif containing protein [Corynebacterium tapiri]TNL98472.1 HNH endonuclease [Corynebacterium tapiri]